MEPLAAGHHARRVSCSRTSEQTTCHEAVAPPPFAITWDPASTGTFSSNAAGL